MVSMSTVMDIHRNPYKHFQGIYTRNIKCAKSIIGYMYLLWAYKIHCFITTTNHIARKFNLFLPIPYKGTYLKLLKRIHASFITEVTGCYLIWCVKSIMARLLSHDFDGRWNHHLGVWHWDGFRCIHLMWLF